LYGNLADNLERFGLVHALALVIAATLHPDYVGWDMNTPLPHDRDAAVRSVSGASAELSEYELHPLSVQVYEQEVGVVHYAYPAIVTSEGSRSINVRGKWSEVYLRQKGMWTMISVSGRPDMPQQAARR
jgi:hypothetical protein